MSDYLSMFRMNFQKWWDNASLRSRPREERFADYLPWYLPLSSRAIGPEDTVLCKSGALLCVYKYVGPDMDSCTDNDVTSYREAVLGSFKQLDEHWTVQFEAQRRKITPWDSESFSNEKAMRLDIARNKHFYSEDKYEWTYYVSLIYMPPIDITRKGQSFFFYLFGEFDLKPAGFVFIFRTGRNEVIV